MFSKLVGNDTVKQRLARINKTGRMPGAFVFAGAEGVGKMLFAVEVAKQLNCLQPTSGLEACDVCPACRRIPTLPQAIRETTKRYEATSSRSEKDQISQSLMWSEHRDVAAIAPLGRVINVHQARVLEREANYRPAEGRRRVFLIDDADRLNEAASNALLKTLEEMPATTHVILVAARPNALLATIRSRCQMIRFAPLSETEIENSLIAQHRRAGDDARLAAHLAQGSLARALRLNTDEYRRERAANIRAIEAIATGREREELLRLSETWSDPKRKDDFENALNNFEIIVRDIWRLALGGGSNDELQIVNEDARAQLAQLSARISPRAAADLLRRTDKLRRELQVNINRRVATDALLVGAVEV